MNTDKPEIDVVYTWVDGHDDAWRQKCSAHLNSRNIDEARFQSHNELQFSLATVNRFAPWARKIFVVTDNQRPHWLNKQSHPKVEIVDHQDIFNNPANLPSFNSNVIESQLHRIADLSEHYLYFNDDVFLGHPCQIEDFFYQDANKAWQPITFVNRANFRKDQRLMVDSVYVASLIETFQLAQQHLSDKLSYLALAHGVKPMRKSLARATEMQFSSELLAQQKHKFRHDKDLVFFLLCAFLQASQKTLLSRYVWNANTVLRRAIIPFINPKRRLFCLSIGEQTQIERLQNKLQYIEQYPPFCYCLNQSGRTSTENIICLNAFFSRNQDPS